LTKRLVTARDLLDMLRHGLRRLQAEAERINALNVFPVLDGDTGTNMTLTLTSGVQEMEAKFSDHLGRVAEALSKGLLMGARGNSGVILSQLFRGFAKELADLKEADTRQLAAALMQGVDTAYKAVIKPVEGTILTVSREAARRAFEAAARSEDPLHLMRETAAAAAAALDRTPEQLPILKQVGVVDAGGKGLVVLYEGFVHALSGEAAAASPPAAAVRDAVLPAAAHGTPHSPIAHSVSARQLVQAGAASAAAHPVQARISADSIEYGYCTEFIILLDESGKRAFSEASFRESLGGLGDSIVVVADEDLVKVHIHSEHPGDVLGLAMKFGPLTRIKIENMREQHAGIVGEGDGGERHGEDKPAKPYGIVAVAAGEGIGEIFRSLGADEIVTGGQTMNPSTEDIVSAVRRAGAETVFVLPNNSNIILAAEQAKSLLECRVAVIPTKTVPQGIAALLAFRPDAGAESNEARMNEAAAGVKSGSVTYAVRDSQYGDLTIRQGEYIGMLDSDIAVTGPRLAEVCKALLDRMLERGDEVVTLFEGLEAESAVTDELMDYLGEKYPEAETERHYGGQPLYYYWISVE